MRVVATVTLPTDGNVVIKVLAAFRPAAG
jgi:hypothetical protein